MQEKESSDGESNIDESALSMARQIMTIFATTIPSNFQTATSHFVAMQRTLIRQCGVLTDRFRRFLPSFLNSATLNRAPS